jgi:hypothetical protein
VPQDREPRNEDVERIPPRSDDDMIGQSDDEFEDDDDLDTEESDETDEE